MCLRLLQALLHPTCEIGYTRVKPVWDRYVALQVQAAEHFQGAVNENLSRFQPVNDLLGEIRRARRDRKLVSTAAYTAAVAKNVADFYEQEIRGGESAVAPIEEKLRDPRKKEFLASIYPPQATADGQVYAGGGRDPSDDEGEGQERSKRGEGSLYPTAKRAHKGKRPRAVYDLTDAEWE